MRYNGPSRHHRGNPPCAGTPTRPYAPPYSSGNARHAGPTSQEGLPNRVDLDAHGLRVYRVARQGPGTRNEQRPLEHAAVGAEGAEGRARRQGLLDPAREGTGRPGAPVLAALVGASTSQMVRGVHVEVHPRQTQFHPRRRPARGLPRVIHHNIAYVGKVNAHAPA